MLSVCRDLARVVSSAGRARYAYGGGKSCHREMPKRHNERRTRGTFERIPSERLKILCEVKIEESIGPRKATST